MCQDFKDIFHVPMNDTNDKYVNESVGWIVAFDDDPFIQKCLRCFKTANSKTSQNTKKQSVFVCCFPIQSGFVYVFPSRSAGVLRVMLHKVMPYKAVGTKGSLGNTI